MNYVINYFISCHCQLLISPKQETMDHHAISLHSTHVMAVKDRIDCSALSDEFDIASVCLADVLAKEKDLSLLKLFLHQELLGCICPFFWKRVSPDGIPHYIENQHSTEISHKSEVVRVIYLVYSCLLLTIISLDSLHIAFLYFQIYSSFENNA